IEPADFTLEQTLSLAPGFEGSTADGHALLARIFEWSGGQPYLTQRIARGVARKGGRLDDVDRVVREQFLAPGAAEKDPYLNRIRLLLTRRGATQRNALALLGKLARNVPVDELPPTPAKELLWLGGVTAVAADGRLGYRNRLLRAVFDDRWLAATRPFDWRRAGAVAALAAAVIAVPLWYTQLLPQPYIRTLSVVTQDFALAADAHAKLRRLPGFAAPADRLLADAMARQSRAAERLAEMMAADRVLRSLPNQDALADQLAAEYWLRRANDAMHAERRDEALVLALEALPAGGDAARRTLAELIGGDLAQLRETFRFASAPAAWSVDWDAGELSVVDGTARARRLAFADGAPKAAAPPL